MLAYYIASINVENTFHDIADAKEYKPFNGICLTDTFQLGEPDTKDDLIPNATLMQNAERVRKQKRTPIRIIIGNPPYSVGQKNANDNAQNQTYPELERRIAKTYALEAKGSSIKALYDSYIKAFRWATDRLANGNGIVAFITCSGWMDGKSFDGFRKHIQKEFDKIYVFNLRGAINGKNGDLAKQEGQNVFDIKTGVAITILIKGARKNTKTDIFYRDIGTYRTKKDKLAEIVKLHSVNGIKWETITPNVHGDWLTQRKDIFSCFIPLEPQKKFDSESHTVFSLYSLGINSNRDSWVYSSSQTQLRETMRRFVEFYNRQVNTYIEAKKNNSALKAINWVSYDAEKIKWTSSLLPQLEKGNNAIFQPEKVFPALYRPFFKQAIYFGEKMIHRRGQFEELFPTPQLENKLILIQTDLRKPFSCLVSNVIVDLETLGHAQCFPRYYFERIEQERIGLFDQLEGEYRRHDGITEFIFQRCREMYGPKTTKDDVFYYVYGILHSEDYRKAFSSDLKKMLPRIPLVEEPRDFKAFVKAGRELAELHLNYETQPEPENVAIAGEDLTANDYTVTKMVFGKKTDPETGKLIEDRSVIQYNNRISVVNIPEVAYDYIVSGKSAIEWIMERYRVTTDKDTGIVNDPNAWAREHNNPRYILTLLLSVITVSIKTREIVMQLPRLVF